MGALLVLFAEKIVSMRDGNEVKFEGRLGTLQLAGEIRAWSHSHIPVLRDIESS